MKSSPEPFNLTFPPKEGNNNQDGKRVIEAQCFIHNSAILSLSRETQFIQLSEERALSERQNKRELMRLTHTHTHTHTHTQSNSDELQSAGSDLSDVAALHHAIPSSDHFHSSFKSSHNLNLLMKVSIKWCHI